MSDGPAPLAGSASPTAGSPSPSADSPPAPVPVSGELGPRNERLLLLGVAGYVALLSALMIARGVSVTPDVLLVALGLAAVLLGRGRLFLRDWVPFLVLFFAYELMRGYADDIGAAVHVTDVIDLERALAFGTLPTHLLQAAFHPPSGVDLVAVGATIVYFLHFPLPLATGFLLWLRRRSLYYDYVAALILLCLAGFATYLVLPVAPPWLAAERGFLNGPDGRPLVVYLKNDGFDALAGALGFRGGYFFSYSYYQMASNLVAAFPSLHAAFPFLAFLFARRAFGRAGWLLLGYFLVVVFAIVYLADHYLVDAYAGVAYAGLAYLAVVHAPGRARVWLARLRDGRLERGGATRIDRASVVQGGGMLLAGALGLGFLLSRAEGGSPLALLPWALLLAGAWRAAVGLVGR